MLQNQTSVSNCKIMFELEPAELTKFFTYLTEQSIESKRDKIRKEIDKFLNQKVIKVEIEDIDIDEAYSEAIKRVV